MSDIQRKYKKKIYLCTILVFSLTIITLFNPVICARSNNDPPEPKEEYYFENIDVLIFGRCRGIGSEQDSWVDNIPLFIGNVIYPDIDVYDTFLERIHVIVYNDSISDSCTIFSRLSNADIFMWNATGIFFWGAWKQYSTGPIPNVLFVLCHADRLWIRIY